jgi:hypothetical protein
MFVASLTSMLLAGVLAATPAAFAPAALPMSARTSATAPPAPEADFSSKDGRFSIVFPEGYSTPKLEKSDIPSELGKIKLYMFTSLNDAEGVCLVGYSDINGVTITNDLKEKMLDGAKEGALKNMNATLENERTVELDGNPGRSLLFVTESGGEQMHGRFDYYMVGNRLYQIGYIAIAEGALDADHVVSYFDSFKLAAAKSKKRR